MKKKTKSIILIVVGVAIALFFYARHNFENDKQTFLLIKGQAANGEVKIALDKIDEIDSFSNPLINIAFQKWKSKMHSRFINNDEVIAHTTDNKIVNDISEIYRNYWRQELLKGDDEKKSDSLLYDQLSDYLVNNSLTDMPRDSLRKTIQNDSVLTSILTNEGFKTKFMLRNGFQEVIIWDKETEQNYTVVLPKDTVNTKVVFIEEYHLNGYDYFATFGSSQVGGWAIKESATLYCNKGQYDLNSEKFDISYLKHESIHFTDLNQYPNLSSTDLEYRAKVIELMHCTEKSIFLRISDFLTGASNKNRNHSHPYANHSIIQNLSKLLFDSEFESDFNKWKKLSVKDINDAAAILYSTSEETLRNDASLSEII